MSANPLLQDFARTNDLHYMEFGKEPDGVSHEYVYLQDENGRKLHRFGYAQTWDSELPLVLWVMLNPGTGDTEERKRPTLSRCVNWSKRWGYGGLLIGNVCSLRTKSAKDLLSSPMRTHALNTDALRFLGSLVNETVVAWGNHGRKFEIANQLLGTFDSVVCLGLTAKGQPRHPLYVPGNAERRRWGVC